MKLGNRLRIARKKRGLTQVQLSAATRGNASQAMISALEKRDSETTVVLFDLAQALNISPEWLLTGREPSGLDKPLKSDAPDPLLLQLIDLYGGLSREGRDQLLSNANWLFAQEHPTASPSNPFGTKPAGAVLHQGPAKYK